MRAHIDLFVVSVLTLFLELACIRWFPAHVLFLTFFTNTVLLACFLGISIGCLAAGRRRNYLTWTPLLLVLALGAAHWIEWERQRTGLTVNVGNPFSPQLVFFGVEFQSFDPSQFVVPIEAVSGVLFVLIALALIGPGQQLGRSLARVSNRVEAYTVNIAGSIVGILLFTACSWWSLGPVWWFGLVLTLLTYLLRPEYRIRVAALVMASAPILWLVSSNTVFPRLDRLATGELWSPYYRIDYTPASRLITVNLMGHQQMISRRTFSPAYALPHLLNRDSGRPPLAQVLVIGAGSGNDVSRALEWGAERVDAVEIDPLIYRLGSENHPDNPYRDRRVFVHLDDGRNYLRSTNKQYDLIIYALVDSLVLHSSYSNIRLESYLFTTEAFADVRKRLKPGGLFVMYNYFRQGWIVSRLGSMLEATFGGSNPIVFSLPAREVVRPNDVMFFEFTVLFAGATGPIKDAFARGSRYWIRSDRPSDRSTPNGFTVNGAPDGWLQFRPTTVVTPSPPLRFATDAWPFLYLRQPMIPALSLRGMAVMGGASLLFLAPFIRRRAHDGPPPSVGASRVDDLARMFFLGAGFMLVETKAVVYMALLFGSTWIVNSIVFCAVLTMILIANLFVLAVRVRSLTPFYIGLLLSLVVNAIVPMDMFLGLPRGPQVLAACLLAFTPILFAAVVFALSFSRTASADRAFGANIAGAMVGGLSENSSMLLGFQHVALVAFVFYALSWAARERDPAARPAIVRSA